jgi:hypothetical protein
MARQIFPYHAAPDRLEQRLCWIEDQLHHLWQAVNELQQTVRELEEKLPEPAMAGSESGPLNDW